MTMRQVSFFGVCMTFFAIASSIQGNGALTGDDIEEQARSLLVRYKQGGFRRLL